MIASTNCWPAIFHECIWYYLGHCTIWHTLTIVQEVWALYVHVPPAPKLLTLPSIWPPHLLTRWPPDSLIPGCQVKSSTHLSEQKLPQVRISDKNLLIKSIWAAIFMSEIFTVYEWLWLTTQWQNGLWHINICWSYLSKKTYFEDLIEAKLHHAVQKLICYV